MPTETPPLAGPAPDHLIAAAVRRLLSDPSPVGRPVVGAVDAQGAADFYGVSLSKWRQLDADGHVPGPVRLGAGRCPRWPLDELRAHLLAGAPTRRTWTEIRAAKLREFGTP